MFSNLLYGLRAGQVIWTALPILASLLRDWRRWLMWGDARTLTESGHQKRARNIRNRLERLGIVFIKVGQVISSRGDLLPPVYLNELSRLQDAVRPLSERTVHKILEREYGKDLSNIFDDLSIKPLATASIGQVHRAVYNKRDVVVKFARPKIQDQLRRDGKTAVLVLSLTERIFQFVEITEIGVLIKIYRQAVTEVFRGMMEETDLAHERHNAEMLARALADVPDVVIPKTIPEICTDGILVLEYWNGTKV